MKNISMILGMFILFLCVNNIVQAQDPLEMVNTPEALRLRTERDLLRAKLDSLKRKYKPVYERFSQVSEELGELRIQMSKSNDDLSTEDRLAKLNAEMESLRSQRDSIQLHKTDPLLDRSRKLGCDYAKEITKAKEPQTILKKMKEANEIGDRALAQKVLEDYTENLLTKMREKFRLRKIDKYEMKAEHDAVIKLNEALTHLAYSPYTVTDFLY